MFALCSRDNFSLILILQYDEWCSERDAAVNKWVSFNIFLPLDKDSWNQHDINLFTVKLANMTELKHGYSNKLLKI